jgi:hypothetical protein
MDCGIQIQYPVLAAICNWYRGVWRVCIPPASANASGMKNAQLESQDSENTYMLAR